MIKILKKEIVFIVILIISVFVIYGKSIWFDFVGLDDDLLIRDNIQYISNIQNIPKFFINSCYYSNDYFYYRPVLNLSFAVEAVLFGNNAKIYHFTNILLFVSAVYLIYVFLSGLKLNKNILKCVILLTAVHPAFTSSAVWIAARNDTLLIIFSMLCLNSLVNYINKDKLKYLVSYTLFFAISLFTKETALVLIPVCFILIYVFEYKITKKQTAVIMLLFSLVLVIYFILRHIAVPGIPIKEYILNSHRYALDTLKGIMIYTDKFIRVEYMPVMLYKARPEIKSILINITGIIILFMLFYKKLTDRKFIIFGSIWFVIFLIPTFFQFENLFLQHRAMISSVGIILMLTACMHEIVIRYPVSKKYFTGLFIILFATYSYASYKQADKYKNSDIFWINAYLDAPHYHGACAGLSRIYFNNGDLNKSEMLIKKALSYKFTKRHLITYAAVLFSKGESDKAEQIYLNISKELGSSKYLTYVPLSRIYLTRGNNQKALEYAKQAFDLEPYNTVTAENLAKIYEACQDYVNAVKIYENLIKIDKNKPEYKDKINLLYAQINNKENINE